MLDVPRELVLELARLLRAKRHARGTRKGSRPLTCFKQAVLVMLVWLRTKGDVAVVGAGFAVSRDGLPLPLDRLAGLARQVAVIDRPSNSSSPS
jgi:hypothetical protein